MLLERKKWVDEELDSVFSGAIHDEHLFILHILQITSVHRIRKAYVYRII